jgi:CheY-like chemotaxis protein
MKRVLFVDSKPRVLDGLRRMLRPLRQEWTMDFAAGGLEALELLTEYSYDVLVTRVRMPEMDGIALLSEAIRVSPRTVRIILYAAKTIWT